MNTIFHFEGDFITSFHIFAFNTQDLKLSAAKELRSGKLTETEFRMVNNMQSSLTIRSI